MQDIRFRYYNPVIGTPSVANNTSATQNQTRNTMSFDDVLNQHLEQSDGVNFSKHATERVLERNIDLGEVNLARLNEGVKIASEKNLNDALILIDQTAFIVNIPSNMVITTKDSQEGNVFTNINGTVIM